MGRARIIIIIIIREWRGLRKKKKKIVITTITKRVTLFSVNIYKRLLPMDLLKVLVTLRNGWKIRKK